MPNAKTSIRSQRVGLLGGTDAYAKDGGQIPNAENAENADADAETADAEANEGAEIAQGDGGDRPLSREVEVEANEDQGSPQSSKGTHGNAKAERHDPNSLGPPAFYFSYDEKEDLEVLNISLGNWTTVLSRGTSRDHAVNSGLRRLADSIPFRRTR